MHDEKMGFNCDTLVLSEFIKSTIEKEKVWGREEAWNFEKKHGISRRPASMRNVVQRISWTI